MTASNALVCFLTWPLPRGGAGEGGNHCRADYACVRVGVVLSFGRTAININPFRTEKVTPRIISKQYVPKTWVEL